MNKKLHNNHTVLFRAILMFTLIAVTYLATIPADRSILPKINDKVNHLTAFAVLAFLADFSFPGSNYNLKKFFPLIIYGILIETIQYFLPTRSFSLLDILADTLGLLLYIPLYHLFSRIPHLADLKAGRRSIRKL